jgi:hypothetical protein
VVIHSMRCGFTIVLKCWGLSKLRCGGEGLVHGVWQVLESAKHLFLGVDPPGQHVPPRVWYGMTCLIIRELWECVLFESNGEGYGYTWDPPGARGTREGETLVECNTGPKEPLLMACSDLLASHPRKCDCAWPTWQHRGSLVTKR